MELSATIPELLTKQASAHGEEVILRKKDRGIWNAVTWSELREKVRVVMVGLREDGLSPGETVVTLCGTRPELAIADLAILSAGAVSAAAHPDDEAPEIEALLRRTRAAAAIVEGEEQLDKVLLVRAQCPDLRRIVIVDMKGLRDFQDPACVSLEVLMDQGSRGHDWASAYQEVKPDAPAAILTSGQTITHAEIMRAVQQAGDTLGLRAGDERLAVLPMSDPTERVLGLYLSLAYRIVSNYLENPETATENLREVKPAVFGANAEAWERLHDRTTGLASAATGIQRALYHWAFSAGGGFLADLLVLRSVRNHLGFGKLRVAYVGDGAISPETDHWAKGLGIVVRHIDPFQS